MALKVSAPPAAALPSTRQLNDWNQRSDRPGWIQTAGHLSLILISGWIWGRGDLPLPVRLSALVLLGLGLAFGFCAMHECGHRTAFASRRLNDAVAWWAGVLSFYNADFYRRYHQWHHRFTHQVGLDPELEDAPPTTLGAYLLELSGLPWWWGKLRTHPQCLNGSIVQRPYMSSEAIPGVRRSVALQLAVYGALALASIPGGNGFLLWFWLLPLALGQPLLRFVLMAEHNGCALGPDVLANTRTTLTAAPLRWLMWNMPFHSEHHLYPSLPFHVLARAHQQLAPGLHHCDPGYLAVHRRFLADLNALAVPRPR